MDRRDFLLVSSAAVITAVAKPALGDAAGLHIGPSWYASNRRFVDLPMARVAYVEIGRGPVALFIHGFPLNSFQWRGALERLRPWRRCIAPDMMSLGLTEVPDGQPITPRCRCRCLPLSLTS